MLLVLSYLSVCWTLDTLGICSLEGQARVAGLQSWGP